MDIEIEEIASTDGLDISTLTEGEEYLLTSPVKGLGATELDPCDLEDLIEAVRPVSNPKTASSSATAASTTSLNVGRGAGIWEVSSVSCSANASSSPLSCRRRRLILTFQPPSLPNTFGEVRPRPGEPTTR